ncbi:MAG: hypothetical protein ACR2Q4_23350 [Geminicoccaceae bacterium]
MTASVDPNTDPSAAIDMRNAIDVVEEAYEFMLAYAAQGRKHEAEDESISRIRQYLIRFGDALDDMAKVAPVILATDAGKPFGERFLADIAVTRSVIALLMERPSITSDMVDNTNGLIAVRALLTDLFFIDQAVLPAR